MSPPIRSLHVPQTSTTKLEVPGLGAVKGLVYDEGDCVQYLGLPYATVPGRFRRSVVANQPWENGEWDGTKLGPYCPQPPRDFYPIPNPAPRTWVNTPGTDEFNCLNLNISVPKHSPGQKLPVMVFFHGGAFTYSTGSSPIYDGRILATTSSLDLGMPTIIISINYRLGVYGFLAGHDIRAYNEKHGEKGVGNYGVLDQVNALRWIQQNIEAFGGDKDQVTIFGQSAGSVSVHTHLLRQEKLFSSAILQSGLITLCGVHSVDEYQNEYEKVLLELGIPLSLTTEERVARLLEVPEEKLTMAMVPVWSIPVITTALCNDGELLGPGRFIDTETYYNLELPDWCPRIMEGDAKNECIIWNKAWRTMEAPEFLEKIYNFFGGEAGKLVASLYGVNEYMNQKETFYTLERLTTDGMYRIPHYLATLSKRKIGEKVFAWHFDVPSPYENEWGGLAHHSFDNVMIWSVLKHTLPEKQQLVGEKMVEAWISFANGKDPWESFDKNNKFCVISETGLNMKTAEEDRYRGYAIWDQLIEHGLVTKMYDLAEELCLQRKNLVAPITESALKKAVSPNETTAQAEATGEPGIGI